MGIEDQGGRPPENDPQPPQEEPTPPVNEGNDTTQDDYDPEQVMQQVGDPTVGGVNRANATMPQGQAQIRTDAPLANEIATVPNAGEDVGEDEFSKKFNEDLARGFRGAAADPTPNENYTVGGVTGGAPTPETSGAQRAAARGTRTLDEGVERL